MKKNDVLDLIRCTMEDHIKEGRNCGINGLSTSFRIKDNDDQWFVITVADDDGAGGIPQSVKTRMHSNVCDRLCFRYAEHLEEGDALGGLFEAADGETGPLIYEHLSTGLNLLEDKVLDDTDKNPNRDDEILDVLYKLALRAVVFMVELDNESAVAKPDAFRDICLGLNHLYDAKNQDYGDAFAKSLEKYGLTMTCIRLADKLSRFKALAVDRKEQKVNDESIRDTLMDFANYTILTLVELLLKIECV